jgi:CheY-like chemotaxis protein
MAGKILLADESLNSQRLWAQCLVELGYHVTAVSSGAAAIERLPELRPDLVIADNGLNGATGTDLCATLRQHPEWGRIPLILTLKAFDQGSEEELRAAGAAAVLRKPFSPAMLEQIVNELLQPEVAESPEAPVPEPEAAEPGRTQTAPVTEEARPAAVPGPASPDLLEAVLQEAAFTAPLGSAPAAQDAPLLLRQILQHYLSPALAEQAAAEIERSLPLSRT